MQAVPITTKVVSSNRAHGEVYWIQHHLLAVCPSSTYRIWQYYSSFYRPFLIKALNLYLPESIILLHCLLPHLTSSAGCMIWYKLVKCGLASMMGHTLRSLCFYFTQRNLTSVLCYQWDTSLPKIQIRRFVSSFQVSFFLLVLQPIYFCNPTYSLYCLIFGNLNLLFSINPTLKLIVIASSCNHSITISWSNYL